MTIRLPKSVAATRVLWWAVALLGLAMSMRGALGAPTVTSLDVYDGAGIERGVVRIHCAEPRAGYWRLSRGVVIDLGESAPRRDVILAPAHGLPADPRHVDEDCRVSNADGTSARIARLWLSPGRGERMAHDWAVLLTASPLPGDVGRLRMAAFAPHVLERLVDRDSTVAVMLSTARADLTGCRLLDQLEPDVFMHSCRSWHGLSGAPILMSVHGEPVVIGINVGHRMRPRNLAGPLFIGVGLAIDREIEAAIRDAADEARAGAGSRVSRR